MTAYRTPKAGDKPPDVLLDSAAVRAHLTRLHEGRPFELRAVRRGKGRVYAGYFDDVDAAVHAVASKARGDAKGWYTTLNPINPELLGRAYNRLEDFPAATTADRDATAYRHLLIDVDPARPAETSSTDEQLAAALGVRDAVAAYLSDELGWPAPLYRSMSGNGGALVYRLAPLPNDPESGALLKGCLEALGDAFGTAAIKIDQTVCNPARITKLIGTPVRKGDDTPRQPHRMAVAEYGPAAAEVAGELLRALAATSAPRAPVPGAQRGTDSGPGRAWRLDQVLQRSGVGYAVKIKPYGTVYVLDRCLTSDAHEDGATIIEAPSGRLYYRCLHDTCTGKRWADAKATLDLPQRPTRTSDHTDGPPDDGAPHPAETSVGTPAPNSANSGGSSANGAETAPQPGGGHSANSASSARRSAEAEWAAPAPLAADLPPFPVDRLPGWLRTFVLAEAKATQTPPDLAAMLVLAVVATAAAGRVKVSATADWTESLNLYLAPALESGNRKSAVFRHATAPLMEWEQRRARDAAKDIAAARARRKIAEAALEAAEARAAKADDPLRRAELTAEAEALARNVEAAAVPAAPRLLADDCTPEKLTSLICEQGGRIATLSPEGDVFDLMGGRYGNAPNLGVYLKAHAGDEIRVDRQGRPSEYIADPALVLGVSPQPDVLKGLGERPGFRGRGLLARFLYALPESLLGRREGRQPPVPDVLREQYKEHVQALLDACAEVFAAVPVMGLTEDAREALYAFADELEPRLGPYGDLGAVKDWAGKLAGAVLRIAGLLHLAGHSKQTRPWAEHIPSETMADAVAIGRYLIPHAQAVHDLMGLDPGVADARHVVGWVLAKRRESFSKRDAFEATKGRFKKAEELDPALRLLEERGYLRRREWARTAGRRGRTPSPVYDANPLLFAASPPPPRAPSHYSQNSQKAPVPESDGARGVPPRNGYRNSQSSAAWPAATPYPSAAAVANGHARHLPDEREGFETVPAVGGGGGQAGADAADEEVVVEWN
jgi:hypothetical protein